MLLQNPEHLVVPAASYTGVRLPAFGSDGRTYAPQQVWQRESEESFDTPENRFVKHFLHALLATIGRLTEEHWWQKEQSGIDDRKEQILALAAEIEDGLRHDVFDTVGLMQQFPAASQVLMRREGYRQMRELWQSFFCAREPFFAPLQEQIDLRQVDKLYEYWVFFKLVRQIAETLEVDVSKVRIRVDLSNAGGLSSKTCAEFGEYGKLLYNKKGDSYGAAVRPDFLWQPSERSSKVRPTAFDAKFRLKRDARDGLAARPKNDDLLKMHAYRDALKLKAAIICYPGNVADYHATHKEQSQNIDLKELLTSEQGWQGVGAMPMPVE